MTEEGIVYAVIGGGVAAFALVKTIRHPGRRAMHELAHKYGLKRKWITGHWYSIRYLGEVDGFGVRLSYEPASSADQFTPGGGKSSSYQEVAVTLKGAPAGIEITPRKAAMPAKRELANAIQLGDAETDRDWIIHAGEAEAARAWLTPIRVQLLKQFFDLGSVQVSRGALVFKTGELIDDLGVLERVLVRLVKDAKGISE